MLNATTSVRIKRSRVIFLIFLVLACAVGCFLAFHTFRGKTVLSVQEAHDQNAQLAKDRVPIITEPAYESVRTADQYLNNDGVGIVTVLGGKAVFYPYQILVWHQAVEDVLSGEPILVLFDPIAFSGAVYRRTVGETVLSFGFSDRVVNGSLLLYDRATESLWHPISHAAISGTYTGSVLPRIQSWTMTWTGFKQAYPNGDVLARAPALARDYTHNPYGNYEFDARRLFSLTTQDHRLSEKTMIYGVEWNGHQKAFRAEMIQEKETWKDRLGETPIELVYNVSIKQARAFILDDQGERQTEIPLVSAFWFAWVAAFPMTWL